MEAEDLRQEDAGADEDAWYQTQEASQVLWRNLAQIHRNHAERDPCSGRSREEVMIYNYITIYHCAYLELYLTNYSYNYLELYFIFNL